MKYLVFSLLIFLGSVLILSAQTIGTRAYFEVTSPTPRLGEPFILRLIVESDTVITEVIPPTDYPAPEDEVLQMLETLAVTKVSDTTHMLSWRVVLWRTGDYLTPEMTIDVQLASGLQRLSVQSVALNVPSLLSEQVEITPYPDLAGIDLPYTPWWVYLIAISVPSFTIFGFIYRFRRWRLSPRSINSKNLAIARLQDLQHQNLSPLEAYPLAIAILRDYLQTFLETPILEFTSSELSQYLLQENLLDESLRRELRLLLEQADIVKFARFEPADDPKSHRFIQSVLHWVRQVKTSEMMV